MLNYTESTVNRINVLNEIQIQDFSTSLLVYDVALEGNALFSAFIKSCPHKYAVCGGEKLKNITELPLHLEALLSQLQRFPAEKSCLVGLGGGAVSDFTGFVASIIRRGMDFHLIPTTWLAAVDSAHGGKSAMNANSAKNQIGSIHCAQTVTLCHDILMAEPENRFQDALAEVIKIILIGRPDISEELTMKHTWDLLPSLIESKMKIVRQDLFDQKNIRAVLNFGHTVGHVLESAHGISHGQAVALGLRFSCRWSEKLGILGEKERVKVGKLLEALPEFESLKLKPLTEEDFISRLVQDKKSRTSETVNFIFIRSVGDVFVKPAGIAEIVDEARRQGIIVQGGR